MLLRSDIVDCFRSTVGGSQFPSITYPAHISKHDRDEIVERTIFLPMADLRILPHFSVLVYLFAASRTWLAFVKVRS